MVKAPARPNHLWIMGYEYDNVKQTDMSYNYGGIDIKLYHNYNSEVKDELYMENNSNENVDLKPTLHKIIKWLLHNKVVSVNDNFKYSSVLDIKVGDYLMT